MYRWHCTPLLVWKNKISGFIDLKTSRSIKLVAMVWQNQPWMNSPSASDSFRFAYDVESASRSFSKWRWNVSHARLCACYRATLGHIGTVVLSPNISLIFPKIFMARGRYLKDTFKKHRQNCEHPKNAKFDIYAITSNFLNKFLWHFGKKVIII